MQNGGFTFISLKFEVQDGPNTTAKKSIKAPPWTGPCTLNVGFSNGLGDTALFFCKQTYLVKIFVGLSSNALLTLASLLHTGADPNLIKKEILSQARKDSIKFIK